MTYVVPSVQVLSGRAVKAAWPERHGAKVKVCQDSSSDASPSQQYLLGDDADESRRLAAQHRVWAEPTYAGWRRAGFGVGDTLLDLGCGPGLVSVELAEWVGPEGQVVAADQSSRFLDALRQRAARRGLNNIRPVQAAVSELTLMAESLDGAYARWLFCFLPNPSEVIERIVPALKPGARLVTLDYFNYRAFTLAPHSEPMTEVVAAIESSWAESGGSLAVQGDMPALMAAAGLEVCEVRNVSRVARPGSVHWQWPEDFLRSHLPTLVASGAISASVVASFWSDWRAAANRPDAYLMLPPLLEIHGRLPLG